MIKTVIRESIDGAKIQIIELARSDTFIFCEYINDLMRDGLLVMRIQDISSIETTLTDAFQYPHIQNGIGSYPKIDANAQVIDTWADIFKILSANEYVCIEEENDNLLYMGVIKSIHVDRVVIHEFLGSGRWMDGYTSIYYDDITSFQVGNRYMTMYKRIMGSSQQVDTGKADPISGQP